MKRVAQFPPVAFPRRRFLQGLAAGGVLLGAAPWLNATAAREIPATAIGSPPVLTGTEFDLTIAETAVNFTGRPRMATTINGSLPGPTLGTRGRGTDIGRAAGRG